jgi:asparagine synthase (glutamine-hydrolysing)
VKTFSIGYRPLDGQLEDSNEFEYARLAAGAFHADHHEYQLTPEEFEGAVPELVWCLDEPLADASCIPLFFISKLAREHITVVLSGEGADEILAGYGIYRRMLALERIYQRVPGMGRLAPWMGRFAPSGKLRRYLLNCGEPLEKRYRGVDRGPGFEERRRLIGDARARASEQQLRAIFERYFSRVRHASPLNRMLYVDAKVWLPDDLLNKADKMTMANGLELRVPFLDHKMVEFAAGLPDRAKLHGGSGKALLRKAMKGVLPEAILHRPKKGFPAPLSSWLRGPLRQFSRENLLRSNSACSEYLNASAIARILQEHENGADRSQQIWTLLVFEFWQKRFIQSPFRRRHVA